MCERDGCERRTHAKGLCRTHYHGMRRKARREANPKNNRATGINPGVRIAELRLALEAASARVSQALLLLEHGDLIARTGRTPDELLREALTELDNARHR